MSEHTKEPWESYVADWDGRECVVLGEKDLEGTSSRLIAIITETATMNASDGANARRIVACVNACAGIENPEKYMADIKCKVDESASRCSPLITERDEWKRKAKEALHLLALVEDDVHDAHTLGLVRTALKEVEE